MLGEGPGFSTPKSEWKLGPSQGRNQETKEGRRENTGGVGKRERERR